MDAHNCLTAQIQDDVYICRGMRKHSCFLGNVLLSIFLNCSLYLLSLACSLCGSSFIELVRIPFSLKSCSVCPAIVTLRSASKPSQHKLCVVLSLRSVISLILSPSSFCPHFRKPASFQHGQGIRLDRVASTALPCNDDCSTYFHTPGLSLLPVVLKCSCLMNSKNSPIYYSLGSLPSS